MDDTPYTTPDEDPFTVTPLPTHSTTLLDNCIKQPALETRVDPPPLDPTDDACTLHSYVLIDQDDIPSNPVSFFIYI
jgi:hypothetical protein